MNFTVAPQMTEDDFERAAIGACLLDHDAAVRVVAILGDGDIAAHPHRLVLKAVRAIVDMGQQVGLDAVADELTRTRHIGDVGGPACLTDLAAACPTPEMGKSYARQVVETARRRRVQAIAARLSDAATDSTCELSDAVAEVQARLAIEVGASPQGWHPLDELPTGIAPVPNLPDTLLPEPLRRWLADLADRPKVPLEMAAAPAIAAAGGVIGRAMGICPVNFDHFLVVPNIWAAIVAPSGWMKSPVMAEALRPVSLLAAKARKAHEDGAAQRTAKADRVAAEISAMKADMVKAARDGGSGLDSLEQQLTELNGRAAKGVEAERRYITQDVTVEKLGELLRENPRGLIVMRDELSGWIRTMEKPGREGERQFFLEAWNGTGDFTFDRIGRGTVHVPNLTISVIGGIQPARLLSLVDDAAGGGNDDDGLVQRLQVMVAPDSVPKFEKPTTGPDGEIRQQANEVFEKLAGTTPKDLMTEPDASGGIPYLRFDDDAQELFDAWRDGLENDLRGGKYAGCPAFMSHMAKYRSLMPSLALIFHIVNFAGGVPETGRSVSLDAAKMAAAWCEFLEAHARKVYASELNPGVDASRSLALHITEGHVADHADLRGIYRHHWSGIDTPAKLDRAIAVLAAAGWVRVETDRATGGAPADTLRIHPSLRKGS